MFPELVGVFGAGGGDEFGRDRESDLVLRARNRAQKYGTEIDERKDQFW
jgi:hypothetical protein